MSRSATFVMFVLVIAALAMLALAGPTGRNVSDALSQIALPVTGSGAAEALAYQASQEEMDFGAMIIMVPEIEVTSDHADDGHAEAELIRQTCKHNGVYQVWREIRNKDTFHLLCILPDGRIGDWIIRRLQNGRRVEKTAFVPKLGTWKTVLDYLAGKATRYNKGW